LQKKFDSDYPGNAGIHLSATVKDVYTTDGLSEEFMNDWRRNIFVPMNRFIERYGYNVGETNADGVKRPSIDNGFVIQKDNYTKEEALREIDSEYKSSN
jgi:hypothetical protein